MKLEGQVAVVTGASSGIGRASAVALAREGAAVVLASRRQHRLAEVAEGISASGGDVVAVAVAVTSASGSTGPSSRCRPPTTTG